MAGDTTPPDGATRYIETTRGLLTYSQLAPLLAERVLRVEHAIASGTFAAQPLAADLLLQFHRDISGDLVPEWAGRWRNAEVRVGLHHPPLPHRVPMLMRDYGEDLRIRLENAPRTRFAALRNQFRPTSLKLGASAATPPRS